MINVRARVEPDKVRVYGDGVLPSGGVLATLPVTFSVDTTQAGDAQLNVNIKVWFFLSSLDVTIIHLLVIPTALFKF